MAENSNIEWTTHTFNPWIGCQKVSPGCDNCYAEALMDKRYHKVEWGPHGERKRTSDAYWRSPLRWAKAAEAAGYRHRVFCASLADWLDNQVPQIWREDLMKLIRATPQLDWLLLTKRPENYERLAPWKISGLPANVWLGVTAEDQKNYDRRYGILMSMPANVRFVSYEPALGPLSISNDPKYHHPDLIICGGESGRNARMMNERWARDLRDECFKYNVAFFMKQMTGKKPIPTDLFIRQFPVVRSEVPT